MRRLAVTVAATPLIVAAAIYRRGYAAPLLFGVKLWWLACAGPGPDSEPDIVA